MNTNTIKEKIVNFLKSFFQSHEHQLWLVTALSVGSMVLNTAFVTYSSYHLQALMIERLQEQYREAGLPSPDGLIMLHGAAPTTVSKPIEVAMLGDSETLHESAPEAEHIEKAPEPITPEPLPAPTVINLDQPSIPETQPVASSSSSSVTEEALAQSSSSSSPEDSFSSSSSSVSSQETVPTVAPAEESSSSEASIAPSAFPEFGHTVFPVYEVPAWGEMRTPAEWNQSYREMKRSSTKFAAIPRYSLSTLTIPMESLTDNLTQENMDIITAKLFYSTRYYGAYNLDAGEFTGKHPAVDLKLAEGTPVGAIAGGRVQAVRQNDVFGIHVIIEHRLPDGTTVYSIYAHLSSAAATQGQDIRPGQLIGYVGLTGNTSGPHLHLQVDLSDGMGEHTPYMASSISSNDGHTLNPISFIWQHAHGE